MKRLVLMRHAKAKRDGARSDRKRRLTTRGVADARRMGAYLGKSGFAFDAVWCSTARRCKETWKALRRPLRARVKVTFASSLYLPDTKTLLDVLRSIGDDVETVLVIGHSPSLDAVILHLTATKDNEVRARILRSLPTAALAVFELDAASFGELDAGSAQLVRFVTPDDLLRRARSRAERPHHASPSELSRHVSRRALAEWAFGEALGRTRKNQAGALSGDNSEFLHQLRVGVRSLRVYVRLFQDLMGPAQSAELLDELRWLFRSLGPVREYDVFLRDVLRPITTGASQRALIALQRAVCEARDQHQRDAAATLASPRYMALIERLVTVTAELSGVPEGKSARRFLSKRLERLVKRVRRLQGAIYRGDATDLHTLRKELKKLRYAAELARGLFDRKPTRRYLAAVTGLQDALGEIQDLHINRGIVVKALASVADPQRPRAANVMEQLLEQRLASAVAHLLQNFETFASAKPFWR